MTMKLMKAMQRVPGGMMVIPLLVAAAINTFFPELLRIGGFTEQLFVKSAGPLVALYLLCCCAGINIKQVGVPLKKGLVLFVAKVGSGFLIGFLIAHFFGMKGIFGLSPIAIIPGLTAINGGMYGGVVGDMGDASDLGALAPVLLGCSPFFTLIALGSNGLMVVPYAALVAVILPMIVGFVLGNIDDDWKNLLTGAQKFLIPFFAFALGMNMNLKQLLAAGPQGILLGAMTLLVTGLLGYLGYRLFFKNAIPAVGAAIATTAGLSVAFPAAIAQIDPSLNALVPAASAQISSAVIFTAIFCPVLVSLLNKIPVKNRAHHAA
jgi:2-keto-3-deoxygluconate permease